MYMQNIIALGMISLFTWGCGNSDKQKGETVQTVVFKSGYRLR